MFELIQKPHPFRKKQTYCHENQLQKTEVFCRKEMPNLPPYNNLLRICSTIRVILTVWRRNNFFLILVHPVYKMWITQEPNKLALWNKLHFEEEKTESIEHV